MTHRWFYICGLAALVCTACAKKKYTTHTVVISQMRFNPSVIQVRLHDTVVFVNNDFVIHDVTGRQKKWTSSALSPGMSWNLVATESAEYYCTIHPMMKGQIQLNAIAAKAEKN